MRIARKLAVAVAVSAALAGLGFQGVRLVTHSHAASAVAPMASAAPTPASAASERPLAALALPDFASLVERYGPAVVNISTVQRAPVNGGVTPFGLQPDDPAFELFRRFGNRVPQEQAPRQGVGSGFIVSPDGQILTNAHVVAGASEVTVRLTDKSEFKARVIGSDRRTDVALLKIDATGLPSVKLGDPSKVRVGEWVAAIGSPFGLDSTVTAGIVSAKSRALADDSYVPFIQTDVAINPGNSGGPLFNMAGEVIGINSQIYSRTGGYMGLSFAIPIDVAMRVQGDLEKFGKVHRGRLGVAIQPLTKELAETFGRQDTKGALVASVEPGTAAAKAGIAAGDVIVALDGRAIESAGDLPRLIGEAKPGASVALRVWRKGSERDVRTTLGEAPGEAVAAAAPETSSPSQARLGVAVRPLTAEETRRGGAGLLVERVEGAAAQAGVRVGDVIRGVNDEKVASVEELRSIVGKSRGRVALLVEREGARMYVPVRIG